MDGEHERYKKLMEKRRKFRELVKVPTTSTGKLEFDENGKAIISKEKEKPRGLPVMYHVDYEKMKDAEVKKEEKPILTKTEVSMNDETTDYQDKDRTVSVSGTAKMCAFTPNKTKPKYKSRETVAERKAKGRQKLYERNIKNSLIYWERIRRELINKDVGKGLPASHLRHICWKNGKNDSSVQSMLKFLTDKGYLHRFKMERKNKFRYSLTIKGKNTEELYEQDLISRC